jgi:hypothetical protein
VIEGCNVQEWLFSRGSGCKSSTDSAIGNSMGTAQVLLSYEETLAIVMRSFDISLIYIERGLQTYQTVVH